MKETIKALFAFDRQLLGSGYDDALNWIDKLVGLEIKEIPSGTEYGTWIVPDEWVVRDGWIKKDGKKILDYKKDKLSIASYSSPIKKTISSKELKKHIKTNEDMPDATPYSFNFYQKEWTFNMPFSQFEKLKKGPYEVFIDSEFKPGIMKYGVHTIHGKSDREILLFAHLDHPYQANDNLSAVATLLDMVKKFKTDYTIKLVFCPETIGSIAYVHEEDLSKVEFMIAVDICGNDRDILLQLPWDTQCQVSRIAHCALQMNGKPYRKGKFRNTIGSDEYAFNDPAIGIPGIMITTHPYDEYHTSEDTPEKLNYEKMTEVQDVILKIIEIYEKDFTPKREVKGPLMRSRYDVQTAHPQINLGFDYLWYAVDGKKPLSELASNMDFPYDDVYRLFKKLEDENKISRVDTREKEE